MKHLLRHPLTILAVAATGLAGCSKSSDAKPEGTTLAGSWKLTNRQCYCPAGPTPNETATFTATGFSFSKNGLPASSGTYAFGTVTTCGSPAPVAGLILTNTTTNSTASAAYTLSGNQLVLNYGGPCDAPVDTYERLP